MTGAYCARQEEVGLPEFTGKIGVQKKRGVGREG